MDRRHGENLAGSGDPGRQAPKHTRRRMLPGTRKRPLLRNAGVRYAVTTMRKPTMAKTAAQRQAHYRARRNDGDGEYRINTWVPSATDFALDRLAWRHGLTRRAMLERLIGEADAAVLCTLDLDTPEWDAYFGVTQ